MSGLREALAAGAARLVAAVLRLAGRGATSLPGRVMLAIDPAAISERAGRLANGSLVVSATNGKTTTCAMLAGVLEEAGHRPVHNRAGANMAGGIASALLSGHGDTGLFEVDEFWLDRVVPQLRPRALVLSNLFRDQLDRYGELDTITARWSALAGSAACGRLVLNADDPSVASLGAGRDGVLFFGLQDPSAGRPEPQHASERVPCPACGCDLEYATWYVGHLGEYRCPGCGWDRPRPQVGAVAVRLEGLAGSSFDLELDGERRRVEIPLPGLYNVYNALAAAAGAVALGISPQAVFAGLGAAQAVFGRAEAVSVEGRTCSILLVKNPAGANEVIRTIKMEEGRKDVLFALNDKIADGRDVSWIWDADFEELAGSVNLAVCSGTRAVEMAMRLRYAGFERIEVEEELSAALHATAGGGGDRFLALPTYTAMLELRELLADRGAARRSFA